MILLIDNYDSFSYNLFQLIGSINSDVKVIRNDEYTCKEIKDMKPDRIIISPGPGKPVNAGVCEELIEHVKGQVPILGVCLGHQAICEAFGMKIVYASELMHGKTSIITINVENKLFFGLDRRVEVARYHSLIADKNTLPDCLVVIGESEKGEIMAVKHKEYEIYGVQFHPESILADNGIRMIKNFLEEEDVI